MNDDLIRSIKRFLWRYHLTIFIVIAVSGIVGAIFSLMTVITQSATISGYSQINNATFDQDTINRVKNLSSTPNYDFSLPASQRNNPFTE